MCSSDLWADLPVIAMTADAMVGDRDRALACGMNDHVAKPIRPAEVFGTLARWLRPHALPPVAAAPPFDEQALLSRGVFPGSALHRRLLAMFGDSARSFGARYRDAADKPTATRLAHDLKSDASTLGAQALAEAAGELEAALSRGAPDSQVQTLLGAVIAALSPVLQALDESAPSATSPRVPS